MDIRLRELLREFIAGRDLTVFNRLIAEATRTNSIDQVTDHLEKVDSALIVQTLKEEFGLATTYTSGGVINFKSIIFLNHQKVTDWEISLEIRYLVYLHAPRPNCPIIVLYPSHFNCPAEYAGAVYRTLKRLTGYAVEISANYPLAFQAINYCHQCAATPKYQDSDFCEYHFKARQRMDQRRGLKRNPEISCAN